MIANRATIMQLYTMGQEVLYRPDPSGCDIAARFVRKLGCGFQGQVHLAQYGADMWAVKVTPRRTLRQELDRYVDVNSLIDQDITSAVPTIIQELSYWEVIPMGYQPIITYRSGPNHVITVEDRLSDLITISVDAWSLLWPAPQMIHKIAIVNSQMASRWQLSTPMYLIYDAAVSEGLIALYVSTLVPSCYHFVDSVGLHTCDGVHNLIMEPVDGNLNDIYGKLDLATRTTITFMVLFTLYVLQLHGIVHGDFNTINLFYVDTAAVTREDIKRANTFVYHIGADIYYLPATNIIPKVGDFGLSNKWSSPAIINIRTHCLPNTDLARYLCEVRYYRDSRGLIDAIGESVFGTTSLDDIPAASPDALTPGLFSAIFTQFLTKPTNLRTAVLGRV